LSHFAKPLGMSRAEPFGSALASMQTEN
jgi:hypothetical protein